ncbi:MAG: adenylyltransferase/cytidyltransferase family protein, partial [Kiritimatiellae bacterium]|nr:adenylyltransferase/cytidyltransferase family protein [Kiritimatiellia bacterium]
QRYAQHCGQVWAGSIAGRPLVTVNGCFDMLHLGHVCLLAQARNLGARLLVLVNDDDSVRTYKGAGRPVFPIRFRLHALNALDAVAKAYPFAGDNPLPLLATIRPDIHVKGGSFEETRVREERRLVESWGGRLEIIPLVEGFSTSNF